MEKIENIEQIERKLRKALKLQESAIKLGNEEEANAAAAAIQRILLKYNLEMSDVDLEEKEDPKIIEDSSLSVFRYKSIGGKWEKKLLSVIAYNNLCSALWWKVGNKACVIGRKGNVEVVVWLYEVLSERFVSLGKERYRDYLLNENREDSFVKLLLGGNEKPIGLDTFLRRYLFGCAEGLNVKYYKEEQERQSRINFDSEANKVTTLVLVNREAVDKYVKEVHKPKESKITIKRDEAYSMGYEDGENTQLDKAVSNGSKVKKTGVLG